MENKNAELGAVALSPAQPVIAGSLSSWVFTYTVGRYGIEDSGAIRLAWRMVSDWDIPQFDTPTGYAYTTVCSSSGASFSLSYERFLRPFTNSLLIRVVRGSLKEGDTLTITWGDRSQGGPGARAQSHVERNHEFRLYVDVTGSGRFRMVEQPLLLDVVPGYPHQIQAVLPGVVRPGEDFALTLRCLDECGNPTERLKAPLQLRVLGALAQHCRLPQTVLFDTETGVMRLEGCQASAEGFLHVEVRCEEENLTAVSNPCLCSKEGKRLYWGDLHGQNADTLGTGTLDEYFTFARDKAAVDVVSWQGNDFEITDATWAKVREKTRQYHEEGRFIAYLGYEWSGATPQGGDYNVFFKDDSEAFYPSSNWVSAPNADASLITTPVSGLWERFSGREDVLSVPHVGGRCGNLAYLDERFCPAVELHSHHGVFDWFALEAMRRRLRVGFVASSDDHSGRLGLFLPSSGKTPSGGFDVASGYYGIWADSLGRQPIWEALQARHCYASTWNRIFLHTALQSAMMGDETELTGPAELVVRACSSAPLDRIYLYNWDELVQELVLQPPADNRIRVRWCGVVPGGKHKSTVWSGNLQLEKGRIRQAQNYAIDRADQGICRKTSQNVSFLSSTSGDFDGMLLDIEAEDDAVFRFTSPQGSCGARLRDIRQATVRCQLKEHCFVEFQMANAPVKKEEWAGLCQVERTFPVQPPCGEAAWWVKVMDDNGDAAWASPIFVK